MKRLMLAALMVATPAAAQEAPPPKLLVAIAVDQFSADLFAQYRRHFTGGFARLQQGAVFPSGYQGHAATETCPGHSTILTGSRPSRTGIIANDWIDLRAGRTDKTVYCAEDESVPGSNSDHYTVSPLHLRVPTLGERMKAATPASRVVSVAGKDRAAVMMAGHAPDQIWWWNSDAFVSYAGRTPPAAVTKANADAKARIAQARAGMDLPAICQAHALAVPITATKTIGTGRFARTASDAKNFRISPEFDAAVLGLAADLADELKLGSGPAPDILSVGASATDYVGHTYGTQGTEMCLQLLALDRALGDFLARMDARGVPYAVVLTADHGGHDAPERIAMQGVPEAHRIDATLSPKTVGEAIAARLKLSGQLLHGSGAGDIWIDPTLTRKQHAAVLAQAVVAYTANPLVHSVFTKDQIAATPSPTSPPDSWTLIEEARAAYDAERTGDLVVALKPRITPIRDGGGSSVATHGSFWDYDRRVPILFWRLGLVPFEQPLAVETADIMPTLAALIALPVAKSEIDGRCLDLDAGPATTCPN